MKPTMFRRVFASDSDDFSSFVLAGLIALLVLLAAVIWIAFCVALHRTAKRISAMKRQRRRQVLIANAIHHALAENRFAVDRAAMPAYLASLSPTMTQQLAEDLELRDLPTYEQALQMSPSPTSPAVEASASPIKEKPPSVERVIRIAPLRPPSTPTHPPSYEDSARRSTPLPSVSATVHAAECETHV